MTLEPARAKRWALGLAALVGAATLRVGWLIDDHGFLAVVNGGLPWLHQGPWDIYALAVGDPVKMRQLIEHGPYPWWALDTLRIHFLRPLTSLTLWFDLTHFADAAWAAHLHSVVWWLLATAAVCVLLARLLPPRIAAISMLLFALDDTHWIPVGWVANRHVVVSAAATAFGFWAWLLWRERKTRGWQVLALTAFTAGLAGGESAISMLALVGAWELWGRDVPLRERVLGLLPLAALGLVYIAIYKTFGFGTFGSAIYIDPVAQPLVYLAKAPGRFLALLAPLTLNLPSDGFVADARVAIATSAAGLVGLTIWAAAFRALWPQIPVEQKRALRWLVPATAASLLPSMATFPSDRLLFAASIPGAAMLAMLVDAALRGSAKWKAFASGLLVLHLGIAAGVWALEPGGARKLDAAYIRTAVGTESLTGRVMFLNAPDMLAGAYLPFFRREVGFVDAKSWNTLSSAPANLTLTRTAAQSFDLEGPFLATTLECLFRDPQQRPFAVGDTVQLGRATLTLAAVSDNFPTRLHIALDDPPEAYSFVQWKGGRVVPVALPELGQSVTLVHEQGPLEEITGLGR